MIKGRLGHRLEDLLGEAVGVGVPAGLDALRVAPGLAGRRLVDLVYNNNNNDNTNNSNTNEYKHDNIHHHKTDNSNDNYSNNDTHNLLYVHICRCAGGVWWTSPTSRPCVTFQHLEHLDRII